MSKFGNSAQIVEPIAGCSERKPTLTARRRQHQKPIGFLPIFHSDHRPPMKEEAVLPDFSSTMSPTSMIFCGAMRGKKPPDQVLGLMGNGKTWDTPTYKMD